LTLADLSPTPPAAPDPRRETSVTLLQRLRANEPEAWRVMVSLYGPLVLQWCARAGVRGADADDVSQEVFQAASARLESFRRDREGDTFRGWLPAITRTRIAEHFRRRGRQPPGFGG
jgi:RNA polymerase sigma-70 factor (ECF subfamily)